MSVTIDGTTNTVGATTVNATTVNATTANATGTVTAANVDATTKYIYADDSEKTSAGLIQIQQGTYATEYTAIGTITATGLSVTITPTSLSSKIFITLTASAHMRAGGAGKYLAFYLYDGSTDIASTRVFHSLTANEDISGMGKLDFLDSPATTSPVTYTLRVNGTSDSYPIVFSNNTSGFITAMEIINPV